MTSLFVHQSGKADAPDLVLLHGWGLHGGLWGHVVEALGESFRVHTVDLPGHGYSAQVPLAFDDTGLTRLKAVIPGGATVLGWSLGGILAQQLALTWPGHMSHLVLVSTTPRFTRAWDWPHGVAPAVLQGFADRLANDYRATVLQFLALQAIGSRRAREQIVAMRETAFSRGDASASALQSGLRLLASIDTRASAYRVELPTLVLAGERDTLTPIGASRWLANTLPNASLSTFADGAHALFLSHPEAFVDSVVNFVMARPHA